MPTRAQIDAVKEYLSQDDGPIVNQPNANKAEMLAMLRDALPAVLPDTTVEVQEAAFSIAWDELKKSKRNKYLLYGGLVIGLGWIVLRKYQDKPLMPFGDGPPWRYRGPSFNRRGSVRIGGLSSQQVKFGRAAKGCGGRGYTQKQFRSCMSRALS